MGFSVDYSKDAEESLNWLDLVFFQRILGEMHELVSDICCQLSKRKDAVLLNPDPPEFLPESFIFEEVWVSAESEVLEL
ncbi:hypothetical protein XM48_06785 [Leucobacter sp. Ag1]|nr:hypothetical protein XM48_06785 [Leucobacter sp. Ag1]